MREHKYRAWNTKTKQWLYYTERKMVAETIRRKLSAPMEYTGLQDKYGNDIYEGDKIEYIYSDTMNPRVCIVEWIAKKAGFYPFFDTFEDGISSNCTIKNCEIIESYYYWRIKGKNKIATTNKKRRQNEAKNKHRNNKRCRIRPEG